MTSELRVASLFFPLVKLRLTTNGSRPCSHSLRFCPCPAQITHAWRWRHPTAHSHVSLGADIPYLLQHRCNGRRELERSSPQTLTLVCETLERCNHRAYGMYLQHHWLIYSADRNVDNIFQSWLCEITLFLSHQAVVRFEPRSAVILLQQGFCIRLSPTSLSLHKPHSEAVICQILRDLVGNCQGFFFFTLQFGIRKCLLNA